MDVPLLLMIFTALVWLAVFLLNVIQIVPAELSEFEVKRRATAGDEEAKQLVEREQVLPRLMTLKRMVETAALIGATAVTILTFGWALGMLVAFMLSLLIGPATRSHKLRTFAHTLYDGLEKKLLAVVASWTWLDVFRGIVQGSPDRTAASKAELQHIIDRSASVLSHDELVRFRASLAFDTHRVEDIMTPVSVVDVADVNDSLGPLVLDDLHKTGHSRFPVINGDIHHIVGILYLHDIINLKTTKQSVREAMDPRVHYIHQDQTIEHALHGFLRTHRHLFVVVNDYRETVGVLTLEDVLEVLLGKKIVDEFDKFEDLRAVAESNPRKNNIPKGKTDI